jgi:hypothetical protein
MSVTIAERTHASVASDPEVEPELRVGPQRAGLDLVEIVDHVERAQAAAGLERAVEFGHQHLFVVVGLDLARDTEPHRARRHVAESLDHDTDVLTGPVTSHHPERVTDHPSRSHFALRTTIFRETVHRRDGQRRGRFPRPAATPPPAHRRR